jgi:hypothetical protein
MRGATCDPIVKLSDRLIAGATTKSDTSTKQGQFGRRRGERTRRSEKRTRRRDAAGLDKLCGSIAQGLRVCRDIDRIHETDSF